MLEIIFRSAMEPNGISSPQTNILNYWNYSRSTHLLERERGFRHLWDGNCKAAQMEMNQFPARVNIRKVNRSEVIICRASINCRSPDSSRRLCLCDAIRSRSIARSCLFALPDLDWFELILHKRARGRSKQRWAEIPLHKLEPMRDYSRFNWIKLLRLPERSLDSRQENTN